MRGFTGRRIHLSTRSAATVATGVLLLSALLAPATLAASPNEGSATVDGATGDWSLGADFFATGTHKWFFAPRGTGFLWGRSDVWSEMRPTIPNFDPDGFDAWATWMGLAPQQPMKAAYASPGATAPW